MLNKISFAICGVRFYSLDTPLLTYTGGRINATDAEFNNCYIGIDVVKNELDPLNNPGTESTLTNCKFICNASLRYPYTTGTRTYRGIQAWAINNLYVNGANTEFRNLDVGIRLSESELDINDLNFENCTVGFFSDRNGNPTFTSQHDIIDCKFSDTHTGIYIVGGKQDVISSNVFNVRRNTLTKVNFFGVYLDGATEFAIQSNDFFTLEYGVYVINSGDERSSIEWSGGQSAYGGNIFTNCWRGCRMSPGC